EERQYLRNDTSAVLGALRWRREETLVFLGRLTPEQWRRGSIHVTLGRITFADWVTLIAAHDDKHLDQLKRAVRVCLDWTRPRDEEWGGRREVRVVSGAAPTIVVPTISTAVRRVRVQSKIGVNIRGNEQISSGPNGTRANFHNSSTRFHCAL